MGNNRTGEVQRPTGRIDDDLDPSGICSERGVEWGGCGSHIIAGLEPRQCPGDRFARDEWLVSLDVDDGIEAEKFGTSCNFGHAVSSGLMRAVGKYRPDSCQLGDLHYAL